MSFCLNCGNHKTCDCSGPPPEVQDLRHPATKWFDQQVEEGLLEAFNFLGGTSEECSTSNAGGVEDLRALMTKSFNAGASYACREILDVLPDFDDCEPDDLRYAAEDAYGICKAWLD